MLQSKEEHKDPKTLQFIRDNIDIEALNRQFLNYYRHILEDNLLDHLGQYALAVSNHELIEDIVSNNYDPEKRFPKILDKKGEIKRDEFH